MLTLTCAQCGASFTAKQTRQYCSRACVAAYQSTLYSNRITLKCQFCGNDYQQKPCLKDSSKYCSKKCKSDDRTRIGLLTVNCQICGKEYTRRKSRLGNFCSYTCLGKSKENRITITCPICNRTFERALKRMEISVYCSRACKRIGYNPHVHNRKDDTKPEKAMRKALELAGIPFIAQYERIGYAIDFYLPQLSVALEVDGVYWHNLPQNIIHDKLRDRRFLGIGIRTVRITDTEILGTSDLVELVKNRLTSI